jgi:flagellar M-ring protein FliF
LTEVALTPEQIKRVTTLVKDAVGFDEERGDSVNVINSAWSGDPRVAAGELESLPLWEQPWARDAAKMLIGLIVLLALVFTVLRPLARQFAGALAASSPLPSPLALPGVSSADSGFPPISDGSGRSSMASVGYASGEGNMSATAYEDQIAQARALVGEDPARVAQVVKKWVSSNG